jgi:hypothetical protein
MLIGIPPILSPDLIKILMEMGHGDEIVIGDGNFPASSFFCQGTNNIECFPQAFFTEESVVVQACGYVYLVVLSDRLCGKLI